MESPTHSSGTLTNRIVHEDDSPIPIIRIPTTPGTPTHRVLEASSEHQSTPKRFGDKKSPAMISLWSAPLKLTAVDELTPGKENTVLGKAIQSLGINSPGTPCSSKSKESALTPVKLNRNKRPRSRKCSMDDSLLDDDEPGTKKACPSPSIPDGTDGEFMIKPKFFRSQSDSAITKTIQHAMDQKENDPMLIGDCSRQYALPVLADGRHHDLKEISAATLVDLLDGKFNVNYTLIDCRYPYEYDGGHVRGALNLYTEAQVYKQYFEDRGGRKRNPSSLAEREVLIFHCEFSVERGPRMCRVMREWDRNANLSCFPSLFYPEMYVLHRGYKGFYEEKPLHCEPPAYKKMVDDPGQLRVYKAKCKTELVRLKSKSVSSIKLGRSVSVKKFVF